MPTIDCQGKPTWPSGNPEQSLYEGGLPPNHDQGGRKNYTKHMPESHTVPRYLGVATQQVLRLFDLGNVFIVNVPVEVSKGNLDEYSIGRG